MKMRVMFYMLMFLVMTPMVGIGQNLMGSPFDTLFMPNRAPLFISYGLIQRSFRPAEIQLTDPGQQFRQVRSHSIGGMFNLEFVLNDAPNFDRLTTLEADFGLSSYSFRADVHVNKEDFGLDEDINQQIYALTSSTEAAIKVNRYKKIGKKSYLRVGIGFNVQSIPFQNQSISSRALILQDGERRSVQLLSRGDPQRGVFGPFRRDVPHRLGFVASTGISWQNDRYNLMRIDLRFSSTNSGDIVDEFNSDFGLSSRVLINKSYLGLNLSYMFCANHRVAKESVVLPKK